jgi:hypothetical protein
MPILPELLLPSMCLSRVGVTTGLSFGSSMTAPKKVHTDLLSMLIAHELSEDIVEELMGSASMMGSRAIATMPPNIHRAAATAEALVHRITQSQMLEREQHGSRIVRGHHLPPYLQHKYRVGSAQSLHQPREVRAVQQLFKPVENRFRFLRQP